MRSVSGFALFLPSPEGEGSEGSIPPVLGVSSELWGPVALFRALTVQRCLGRTVGGMTRGIDRIEVVMRVVGHSEVLLIRDFRERR